MLFNCFFKYIRLKKLCISSLLKKSATDVHQLLIEAYGKHAFSKRTFQKWFQRFKTGDFDVNDNDHGKPLQKF